MALDTNYVLAFSFESVFIDKDTGDVLAGGEISFFRDIDHNATKDIFILSGTAPNYTYVNIGSTVGIGADGCPNYNGVNVALYFFPYTDSTATTVDLYYYEVHSSGGVLQFTRNGQPNVSQGSTSQVTETNYVPNGQFLLHTDIPPSDANDNTAGLISADVTDVAYGGFTYERSSGTGVKDFVTFIEDASYVTNPPDNPRFQIQVSCQTVGNITATQKRLCLKFNDVNKFASSSVPPITYTWTFYAFSNSGSPNIQLILKKFYGSTGSSPDEAVLKSISLTNVLTQYSVSFSFGDNSGKIISGDDDYVQLCIGFPTATTFDIQLTDYALYEGSFTNPTPFAQTNSQMVYQGLAGFFPVPNPDGSDLYLMPRLTQAGWIYDDSEVGNLVSETTINNYNNKSESTTTNRLLADGSSHYTPGYSDLGIPFSRLGNKYLNTAANIQIPEWGCGYQFANTSNTANSPTLFRIAVNSRGNVTSTADGSAPTGFTFTTPHIGADYLINAFWIGSDKFTWWNDAVGLVTAPTDAGASGFTFTTSQNSAGVRGIFVGTAPAGSTITMSTYWQFNTPTTGYYVWYKVDGAGTDPAVGGRTGIQIDILSTYTNAEVAQITREALNGSQISVVTTLAASAIPNSSFFTFSTNPSGQLDYYAWYSKDGGGTDPARANRTGIRVNIAGADTAAQVAAKTQLALNSTYFGTPDFRGMFIRGIDNQLPPHPLNPDADSATRFGWTSILSGNVLGTYEFDQFKEHLHGTLTSTLVGITEGDFDINQVLSPGGDTAYSGGAESRPINANVNYAILY